MKAAADEIASAGQPLAELRGVGRVFPTGTAALAGVDLTVREGEFLSLLGPSGCGKTTILRILAGLDEPTSGTVAGPVLPLRKAGGVGYVFQDATLMPWASVADNVYLPLRIAGTPRRDADGAIGEMLSLVGISEAARLLPHELSGGMRMRVSIARALVTRPGLLLMDEPFAALDEITRFRLNDDLVRLAAELGCTVVFVTHSIYESVFLSDRIAMMPPRPGRIARELRIEFPQPRTAALRRSPAYQAACAEASALFEDVVRS
jgi:NitT/TauT family transport system ATP-binding protein